MTAATIIISTLIVASCISAIFLIAAAISGARPPHTGRRSVSPPSGGSCARRDPTE